MRLLLLAAILMFVSVSFGQPSGTSYKVYDHAGNPATLEQITVAAGEVDVVFLGENHDDATAHALQLEIFKAVVERYSATRKTALSLEMFERDVQVVIDEYLNGLISENHFLLSSRPWKNYATDYKPLFELAKAKKLPVIAANAPRRYINMVSRNGRSALGPLTKDAKEWIAPLPYAQASEAYAAKFKALMGPSPEARMGLANILDSQSLWDATMAFSISRFLRKQKNPLVVHLNGAFHTESRLGTPEHLVRYSKKAGFLVVTMRYEENFSTFDKTKHENIGDFVILTDAKAPRSFKQ
jgi:uncharacterized iron-regulated protein